jgi:hypothetical protein
VREVVGGPDPEGHLGRVRGEQARHDVHQVPDFALVDRQDERFGSREVTVDRADPAPTSACFAMALNDSSAERDSESAATARMRSWLRRVSARRGLTDPVVIAPPVVEGTAPLVRWVLWRS